MELILFIIIGAIAGWLAGQIMRGNGFGLLGDVVVGIIGAFVGGWIFRSTGVAWGGGMMSRLLVAFFSAVVLLFVVRLFTGRRSGRQMWS